MKSKKPAPPSRSRRNAPIKEPPPPRPPRDPQHPQRPIGDPPQKKPPARSARYSAIMFGPATFSLVN